MLIKCMDSCENQILFDYDDFFSDKIIFLII